MGQQSAIEWTDATWNPWQGCTKVSEACANCYMFTDLKRYGRDPTVVVRSKPPTFNLPLKRHRNGTFAIPAGWKVFTCSWSDWFHERADAWRDEAWDIIRQRPDLTFQIVTKRTERIPDCLPPDWGDGWPNVWLIATVENQHWAEVRVPQLLSVPAVVHGLSCEPLLGQIDAGDWLWSNYDRAAMDDQLFSPLPGTDEAARFHRKINWVIAGGESGHKARPMHPAWVRSLRDQCQAAGVAFFFKQWGDWAPGGPLGCPFVGISGELYKPPRCPYDLGKWMDSIKDATRAPVVRVGKKLAGRYLDDRTWNEFPEVIPV